MATYYVDPDVSTGTLTGTVTFTNASTTVTGDTNTLFTTELAVGNYIRPQGGTEWYKVTAITDNSTLTIDHAFYQATTSGVAEYNAGDGSTTAPFCSLMQFISDISKADGDTCLVQTGKTYYYSTILSTGGVTFNYTDWIYIKGEDWQNLGTAYANRPIINFQGTANYINIWAWGWYLDYLDLTNSNTFHGTINVGSGGLCYIHNSIIHDNLNTGIYNSSGVTGLLIVDSCTFYNNSTYSIRSFGYCSIKNSVFNGGSNGTSYGIYSSSFVLQISDSSFGQTTAHSVSDIYINSCYTNNSFLTNILYNTISFNPFRFFPYTSNVKIGVDGYKTLGTLCNFEQDISYIRSGGANNSIKCNLLQTTSLLPVNLIDWHSYAFGGQNVTVTVYVASDPNGGYVVFPTADQLWLEVEYYNSTAGTTTTIHTYDLGTAAPVLSANGVWTAYSLTFTPAIDGVYRVKLITNYMDNFINATNILYVDNNLYVS